MIFVRATIGFCGRYWVKDIEITLQPLTGDTAVYCEGAYKILGRTSTDMIKRGGFKVSALGVERALLEHPSVADVSVVGAPDVMWGQKVSVLI